MINCIEKSYITTQTMKIGFSEYSATAPAIETAHRCHKLGLNAYQLTGDYQINFPESISAQDRLLVKSFNEENGLDLHFHAATDIPLASRHQHLRLSGVERVMEYVQLAIDMGAKSFIFHPGRFAFYKVSSGKIVVAGNDVPDVYIERFYDSAKRLANFATGRINLLMENTHSFSKRLIEIVDDFLKLPSTGLVWDIAHMYNTLNAPPEKAPGQELIADFFASRMKYIKLAHLHDSAGKKSHLALGTGGIALRSYIDILESQGVDIIIEVFSEKDLNISLNYLQSLKIKT